MERAKVAISQDANAVQHKLPWPSFKAPYESLKLSQQSCFFLTATWELSSCEEKPCFSQMAISVSDVFIADSRIRCGIRPWKLREGGIVVLLCAFSSLLPAKTERGFHHALNNSITQKLRIGPPQRVQGWTKRLFPGCVKLGEEVAFCLPFAGRKTQFFQPIFTQPGKSFLEIPCTGLG